MSRPLHPCGPLDSHAYAQHRATATGKPYIVSSAGHAMHDCRAARALLRRIGETVVARFKP